MHQFCELLMIFPHIEIYQDEVLKENFHTLVVMRINGP